MLRGCLHTILLDIHVRFVSLLLVIGNLETDDLISTFKRQNCVQKITQAEEERGVTCNGACLRERGLEKG